MARWHGGSDRASKDTSESNHTVCVRTVGLSREPLDTTLAACRDAEDQARGARIGMGFADATRKLNLDGTRTRSKISNDERDETDDPADARADRDAPCRFGT